MLKNSECSLKRGRLHENSLWLYACCCCRSFRCYAQVMRFSETWEWTAWNYPWLSWNMRFHATHTIAVCHFIEAALKISCKMCGSLFCWHLQEPESVWSNLVLLVSVPFWEAGWFLGLSHGCTVNVVMVSKDWTSASYWFITCCIKLLFNVHKVEVIIFDIT
jgi:hypothetical protein